MGNYCVRGDLNTHSREISPVWGNFHGSSITAGARRRQAFRVASCFPGQAAGDFQGGLLRGARTKIRRSRSVLSADSGQPKYPPIGAPSRHNPMLAVSRQNWSIWAARLGSGDSLAPLISSALPGRDNTYMAHGQQPHFLDTLPFDWTRPEARELRDFLAAIFSGRDRSSSLPSRRGSRRRQLPGRSRCSRSGMS